MVLEDLVEIAWHDAEILAISIDRSKAGYNDTVRFVVKWAEWQPRSEENISVVEFSDCYALEMEMNFGIVAQETILNVWLESEHPKLSKIQKFFKVENLTCVVFETNSTASLIRILTKSVRIDPYLLPLTKS